MKKIQYKQKFLLFLICFFIPLGLLAQQVAVSGKIIDVTDGLALPGVSIVIKGTVTGTITNFDGEYSLQANVGDILIFSFIGYDSAELTVTPNLFVYNVGLSSGVVGLDEVMAIGYGVQRRSDRTGAVSQVRADDLNRGALSDPIQAMQGKASGVMITKKGGDPNAGFSVKIRGASGFISNTQPLYVIDGVPGVDPTTVAPEDIETFDVLKDAASTAIYGSRGSNGVIIITTKRGKEGKGYVNFNSTFSVDNISKKLDLLSASEIRTFVTENQVDGFIDNGGDVDWQDEIYRTGYTQNHNINFSGGTATSNYYASITHSDWQGILRGTNKERSIARINFSHKAINEKLTLSGSLGTTFEQNDYEKYDSYNQDDVIYQALQRNPTDPVRNQDGSYFKTTRQFNYENPLSVINQVDNVRDAKKVLGNFKADFEFFKGLVGTVNLGYTRDDSEHSYFRPNGLYEGGGSGAASKKYENRSQKILESYFNYNNSFNHVHNLSLLGGYSWQEAIFNGFNAGGNNPNSEFVKYNNLGTLLDITRNDIGSYKGMSRLIGVFSRVQYNYNNRYYISASLRRDGSTKFGENNKWGWFPTTAVGWTLSEEEFMQDAIWLNNLKLRASYGVAGNQEIGEYNGQMYYIPSGMGVNPETGADVIIYTAAKVANPNLRWEQTSEINIGLDYALLRSRINGSIEYYVKKTTDLLGDFSVPMPPNAAPTIWANSGEVENQGIEFNIQYFAVDQSNFSWKTNVAVSHNKQKMVNLGEYAPADGVRKEGYLSGRGLIGNLNYVSGVIVGESLGSFYLPEYMGLSDEGKFLYRSTTGGITDELSSARRTVVGTAMPDFEIGWSNNLTIYNNWTVDFAVRSLIGNQVFNATKMFFDYPGNLPSLNALPDAIDWYKKGRTSGPNVSDLYVEDASFLRLDYISLGYMFNTSNVDWIHSLKLSVSGNNLITLTNYSGVDPETSVDGLAFGIDQYNVYPKSRSFSFGVSATF